MEEIYTLTIELETGLYFEFPWKRTIEIPEATDLFDLHLYIQKIIGFDNDHLFEFFIGKHSRNKVRIFADDDDCGSDNTEGLDIKLNKIYPLTGMKLFYFFDFGDSWMFNIKKGKKKKYKEAGVKYPRIIESEGKNPVQYPDY